MASVVRGEVAVHSRRLRREHQRRCALFTGWFLLLSGSALAAASWLPGFARLPSAVLLAAFAIVFAALARHRWALAARTSAGIDAEQRTGRALEKLPSTAVLHNVVLGRGDIDHVVLGPVCWAVETKYGRGRVTFDRGRVLVNGRAMPRDPLVQARTAAASLSRACGVPATAVLVVSEGQLRPELVAGVWVCAPGDLAGLFAASAPALALTQAALHGQSLPVASEVER